ncbi:uncharacterized protein FOMMEDRAFT_157606 [Fomitiporia mediterranea MF3/22]|uniref:uncharacterized protein n=1 Tax=Fomitiporia mediterranea (strain MF3/22) TaxID=694068 RepID=UPI0004408108|nr:uncharacterized protein FOMMEDRAFT_157606 [Fomitiporia mediterranea MF3/22]EJD02396.1 hypothetical protein FOMMEDRAFT_157606 [Fomitiporia mediterranea MF3/22]
MTFLYDVVFALSLVTSGFGPLLYCSSLLNDFSLSGQDSVLLDKKSGYSHTCSPENSSTVSERLAYMTTTSMTPSSSSHLDGSHRLSHLLHPGLTYGPSKRTGQVDNGENKRNAHNVQTNTQESPQSVIFSPVGTTPYMLPPIETNALVAKDGVLNAKSEKNPVTYPRVVLLISAISGSAWKFISRVLQVTSLFFVGLIIGISFSYSGALLSLLNVSLRNCGYMTVQGLYRRISGWLLKRRYFKMAPKHKQPLRPSLNEATSRYHHSLFCSSSTDCVDCKTRESSSDVEKLPMSELDDVFISSDDEGFYAYDCSCSDLEMESRYAFASPFESGGFVDRHMDHFYRGEIDLADKQGAKHNIPDDSKSICRDIDSSARFHYAPTMLNTEVKSPATQTTHALADGSGGVSRSDPVDSDDIAMMSPSLEDQDHFPISPLYIPPHKRFSGLHAKEARSWKNESLPPALTSLEATQLPKSRQLQYEFFKDFLRSFGKRRQAPTVLSTSEGKPPFHCELNWRNREPKTPLAGNRSSSRPVGLERVVGNIGVVKSKDPVVPDKLHDDNAGMQNKVSRILPGSDTLCPAPAAQKVDAIPCSQCRSKVGSSLDSRFKALGIPDFLSGGVEERKKDRSDTTQVEVIPSRILLLRDVSIVGRRSPEKGVPSDKGSVEFDKHNDCKYRGSKSTGIEHVPDGDEF